LQQINVSLFFPCKLLNWSVPRALAARKIFCSNWQYFYLSARGGCHVRSLSFAASGTNHDVFHHFGPRFDWPWDSEFLMPGHVLCVTKSDLLSEA